MPEKTKPSATNITLELEIQNEITKLNIARIDFITIISLLYLIFTFITNFYSHFISELDKNSFSLYSIPYTAAFLINALGLYFVRHPKSKLMTHNQNLIIQFYFWSMLSLSLIISLLDLFYYEHIIVYLAYFIICTGVLVLPFRTTFLPVSICNFILLLAMLINYDWQFANQFNMMLLVFITLISYALSYYNYKTIHQSLLQKNLLIKEQQKSQILTDKLRKVAHTDELTKLANRHGYFQYVDSLEKSFPLPMTTLMIDIDSFKKYNDHYGHIFGDLVLSKVASCLHEICKQPDRFAVRWGGEEFLVLLQNHTEQGVIDVYKQFIEDMATYNIEHEASGVADTITFSVGGNTQLVMSAADLQTSIHFADEAQYIIKHSTKNHFLLMDNGKLREPTIKY